MTTDTGVPDPVRDERTSYISEEDINEKIRVRKLRTKLGVPIAVGGLALGGVLAVLLVLRGQPVSTGELGLVCAFLVTGLVAAGFVYPDQIKDIFRR
jgi:hypothetical protein